MNYTFSFHTLFTASFLLLLMPGCQQPHYNSKSLLDIRPNPTTSLNHDYVTVQATALTRQEAQELFSGRAGRVLRKRKPIYTIYVTIGNKSIHPLILTPENISLKLVSPQIVANRLYSHTSRRIAGALLLGVAGTTASFFAAAYITIVGAIAAMPAIIKTGYATLGLCGVFAIGSPIVSYQLGSQAIKINHAIDADLFDKCLQGSLEIGPQEARSVLLFTPCKPAKCQFSIKLIDSQTQKPIAFDIDLSKGERV